MCAYRYACVKGPSLVENEALRVELERLKKDVTATIESVTTGWKLLESIPREQDDGVMRYNVANNYFFFQLPSLYQNIGEQGVLQCGYYATFNYHCLLKLVPKAKSIWSSFSSQEPKLSADRIWQTVCKLAPTIANRQVLSTFIAQMMVRYSCKVALSGGEIELGTPEDVCVMLHPFAVNTFPSLDTEAEYFPQGHTIPLLFPSSHLFCKDEGDSGVPDIELTIDRLQTEESFCFILMYSHTIDDDDDDDDEPKRKRKKTAGGRKRKKQKKQKETQHQTIDHYVACLLLQQRNRKEKICLVLDSLGDEQWKSMLLTPLQEILTTYEQKLDC